MQKLLRIELNMRKVGLIDKNGFLKLGRVYHSLNWYPKGQEFS